MRSQEDTARASIAPAVLSLVLVALALLLRLLTAASELRLPELALASLRGVTERRLWGLGLVEPLALLVIALPLGVAAGHRSGPRPGPLVARAGAARCRFRPRPGWRRARSPWRPLVVAVVAVGLVLRDSLASQLTGLKRPADAAAYRPGRRARPHRRAAGMLVAQLSAGKADQPDVTDMVLPVVLAVVGRAARDPAHRAVARRASRRSGGRSLPGFVTRGRWAAGARARW